MKNKITTFSSLLLSLLVSFSVLHDGRAESLPDSVSGSIAALHSEKGGYRSQAGEPSSLAGTTKALRAYRYLGIELLDKEPQKEFLLSCFRADEAAFAEPGTKEPTILANAFALMMMAELELPEDVHAVSARDFLVEHVETHNEIYMALAGLQTMGLTKEIPADWILEMMEIAISKDPEVSLYQKARAIISCMRVGFNLPDYTIFLEPLESALAEVLAEEDFHHNERQFQEAYTLARALLMIDGRVEMTLPSMVEVAAESPAPSVGRLYKLAALRTWKPKLEGQLAVAFCTGFAPVGYREASGRIAGMDADLIREFAKEYNYDLIFHEQLRFDGIWRLPSKGHFDVALSGLSKRQDCLRPGIRRSYPYFNVDRSLTILESNADRFRDIADFDGMKIAITAGTTGDQDVLERNPLAIRIPYDNEELAIKDLLAGKVHALARGDVSNRYDARIHPELHVIDTHAMEPVEEFVIAVASERVALGQKLDRFLSEKRRSGELDKLFAKYLNTTNQAAKEKLKSEKHPPLSPN